MGKATDQALRDISATKTALERDVNALVDSVPDVVTEMAGQAAGNIGPKVLGGLGAVAAAGIGLKSAGKSRAKKRATRTERQSARIQAEELARAFGTTATNQPAAGGPLAPRPEPEPKQSGGKGRVGMVLVLAIAAGAAAAWFAGRR